MMRTYMYSDCWVHNGSKLLGLIAYQAYVYNEIAVLWIACTFTDIEHCMHGVHCDLINLLIQCILIYIT